MSDPNQPSVPPGWYPDGQGGQRWWDGMRWTEHTQPGAAEAPQTPDLHQAETQVAPHQSQPGGSTPFTPPAQQPYAQQQPAQPPYGQPAQQPHAQQQPAQPPYGQPAQQPYAQQQPAQPPYGAPQQFGQPYAQAGQFPASKSGGSKGLIIGGAVGAGVILLVCLVGGIFMLGGGSGPGNVVKEYLEAYTELDLEKACELTTTDARADLFGSSATDDCSEIGGAMTDGQDAYFKEAYGATWDDILDDTDIDVEIEEVNEDGDEATVKAVTKAKYEGDNDKVLEDVFDGDRTDEESNWYRVVKEDGDWLVAEQCSEESSCK